MWTLNNWSIFFLIKSSSLDSWTNNAFFKKNYLSIHPSIHHQLRWVFTAAHRLSLVLGSRGYSSCGAWASPVVEQGLWAHRLQQLHCMGLDALPEKATAPHSSTLTWKIPWTEEPGRLQSMGSLRVRHNWAASLSLFTFMHWRRKWQPTPVFLPGESQGQRSLVGCRLWGRTELDTTEAT